jgi:hypothetical protein
MQYLLSIVGVRVEYSCCCGTVGRREKKCRSKSGKWSRRWGGGQYLRSSVEPIFAVYFMVEMVILLGPGCIHLADF